MVIRIRLGLKLSGESDWWDFPQSLAFFFWWPQTYWFAFGWNIHRWVFRLWVGHV